MVANKKGYAVHHKYKGYLCRNEQGQLDYSHDVTSTILLFDEYEEANLLCDGYEEPEEVEL